MESHKGFIALVDISGYTNFVSGHNIDSAKNDKLSIIINYSTLNTNRVNIPVKTEECTIKDVISFDADTFKEILVANKECKDAVLEVSNEGLARMNFKVGEYDSTYYIVASQGVN